MLIRVDHKIRITRTELSHEIENLIVEALSIPNIARQKAMEQHLPGWPSMPETIPLWEFVAGDLVMPRGFGFNLLPALQEIGIQFEVDDKRPHQLNVPLGNPIELRLWQDDALKTILVTQEGIWKAPAGSGKTVGVLEAIRRVSGRSIVIVNTKDILWQWRERARQFLGSGYPVGLIGDGHFEIASQYLTIATAQTLHSRYENLMNIGFFDSFSFMCLDECHHSTAATYNRIVNRFSCRYRIGVSATPDKTGDFALATNVLGPIIHETKPSEVTTLIRPVVYKVPTDFKFKYRGAKGGRPSNYSNLLAKLIEDEGRNRLIAQAIQNEDGHHSLVVSKRLDHLRILEEMVSEDYRGTILRLTGQETSEERQEVVEIAAREPCVIFSTLADEALDIPRLDRIFLVFPQRNSGLITQQVGRIERQHENKSDAFIYDFCDLGIGVCENQWKVRRKEVYEPRGYTIHVRIPAHIQFMWGAS